MLQKLKSLFGFDGARQKANELNVSVDVLKLISSIRNQGLTYLSKTRLASIANTIDDIRQKGLQGCFVEAGCALGGSSILISKQKSKECEFFVYDVFGMIPPPSDEDTPDVHERYEEIVSGKSKGIKDGKYYGYEENLYDLVIQNLESFGIQLDEENVCLKKGLVQDTMQLEQPVAFAHVDVDWYDPVMTCLERVFPKLEVGGSIILDDYSDWGGCKKATDEYLANVEGQYASDDSAGSLKLTRVANAS